MTQNWLDDTVVTKTEPVTQKSPYRASVPLSVYQELAQELKETQRRLKTLEFQKQDLIQENQRLRQQIVQITRATQQLNQVVEQAESVTIIKSNKHLIPHQNLSQKGLKYSAKLINSSPIYSSSIPHAHQVDVPHHAQSQVSQLEGDGSINGWLLAMAIFLIVLTTCTGAFLIVNFKLSGQNR